MGVRRFWLRRYRHHSAPPLSGHRASQRQPDHLHQPQVILIVAARQVDHRIHQCALSVTIEKRPRHAIVQGHVFQNHLGDYQRAVQACIQAPDQFLKAALFVSDIAQAKTSPLVGKMGGGTERWRMRGVNASCMANSPLLRFISCRHSLSFKGRQTGQRSRQTERVSPRDLP